MKGEDLVRGRRRSKLFIVLAHGDPVQRALKLATGASTFKTIQMQGPEGVASKSGGRAKSTSRSRMETEEEVVEW